MSYLFFGMAKESSLKEPFSDDMITDQDLHLFKGAVINLPLRRGDILRRNHLMIVAPPKRVSERIPLGSRAYLLENSAASRLHAGERVDLSFIPTSSPETVMLLAEDALVLEAQGRDELTLALTLEEMESVELARSQGRIGVALRNPTEVRGKGTKKAWSRLRQRRSRTGPDPLRIPVFHEGGER